MAAESLTQIHSCWSVAEAEIVRARLASEGIPAYFENATLVLWYWQYANLTGGVKLFVRESEAEEACRILSNAAQPSGDDVPPWMCSCCGQDVEGTWEICWSCGASVDGVERPAPAPEPPPAEDGEELFEYDLAGRIQVSIITLAILAGLAGAPLELLFVAALLLLSMGQIFSRAIDDCGSRSTIAVDADGNVPEGIVGAGDRSHDAAGWPADELALRAWWSAVFGLIICPQPVFTAYSVWLLRKRLAEETRLGPIGRRRIRAAWAVNLIAIAALTGILMIFLIDALGDASWYRPSPIEECWYLMMELLWRDPTNLKR